MSSWGKLVTIFSDSKLCIKATRSSGEVCMLQCVVAVWICSVLVQCVLAVIFGYKTMHKSKSVIQ